MMTIKPRQWIDKRAKDTASKRRHFTEPTTEDRLNAIIAYLDEQHAAGQGERGKRGTYSCRVCKLDLPHAHDPLVRFAGDHRYSELCSACDAEKGDRTMSHAPFVGQSLCDDCADEPPSYTVGAIRNTLRRRISLESARVCASGQGPELKPCPGCGELFQPNDGIGGHACSRCCDKPIPVAAPPAQPVAAEPDTRSSFQIRNSLNADGTVRVGSRLLDYPEAPVAAEPAVPVAGEPTVTRAHRVKALLARFGGNVAEADRVGWLDNGDDVDPYERELERIAVAIALAESAALAQVEQLTRERDEAQSEYAKLLKDNAPRYVVDSMIKTSNELGAQRDAATAQLEQLKTQLEDAEGRAEAGKRQCSRIAHEALAKHAELTAANERAAELERELRTAVDDCEFAVSGREAANERAARLEAERDAANERARTAINIDRTGLAAGLNHIQAIVRGYWWIAERTWGSYSYEKHTVETLQDEVKSIIGGVLSAADRALKQSGKRADENGRRLPP